MSFHVLGQVLVILGSTKATKDLLEKRGHTYSDRPVIPFFEMCAPNLGASSFADISQDGSAMGFIINKIWAKFPSCAQDCRTGLSTCITGTVPFLTREKNSCPRQAHVGKPTGVGGPH
jgi:hypothetical protein